MSKKYYSHKYFSDRDHLDLHIAESIKLLANDLPAGRQGYKLKAILDVGCGTGRIVKFLNDKGFKAKGCDPSEIAVKLARKINKDPRTIIKASATKLPFKPNSFDLVISMSVIEHLTLRQAQGFLKETCRALKEKGLIFIITPNWATPIRLIQGKRWFGYSDPTHIKFYTPKSLWKLIKSYGFINPKWWFKTKYVPTFDWEFAKIFSKFPKSIKPFFIYLLFSTPLALMRNSFWMVAQKSMEK